MWSVDRPEVPQACHLCNIRDLFRSALYNLRYPNLIKVLFISTTKTMKKILTFLFALSGCRIVANALNPPCRVLHASSFAGGAINAELLLLPGWNWSSVLCDAVAWNKDKKSFGPDTFQMADIDRIPPVPGVAIASLTRSTLDFVLPKVTVPSEE